MTENVSGCFFWTQCILTIIECESGPDATNKFITLSYCDQNLPVYTITLQLNITTIKLSFFFFSHDAPNTSAVYISVQFVCLSCKCSIVHQIGSQIELFLTYRMGQKSKAQYSTYNAIKYWPIFIIFSLSQSPGNLQCSCHWARFFRSLTRSDQPG